MTDSAGSRVYTWHMLQTRIGTVALLLTSLTLLSACHPECLSLAGSLGVQVRVVDAATQQSLDRSATVTAERLTQPQQVRTGALLSPNDVNPLSITQTEGSYRITVSVPGYRPWSSYAYVPSATDACTYEEPFGSSFTAELHRL